MIKKLLLAAILFVYLCGGCANNYLEWRRYDRQTGKKIAEYKAGRQSAFVRSSWPYTQIVMDPNNVHMIGEGAVSDPEKIKATVPYGTLETE